MNDSKSTVHRRAMILDYLEKDGEVSVEKLSSVFQVSRITIRNDLINLGNQRLLIRARGGAIRIKPGYASAELPLTDKEKENFKQKQAIGKKAAELIFEDQTIIFDSGTTTTEIARNLGKFKNLTIITNALNIASILCDNYSFNVFIPGGSLRKKSKALSGTITEEIIKNFYCDILFMGVDGFDTSYGITTPNVDEARLAQQMIKIAKKVVVVADSSKFNRRRFAFISPISDIHTVITDSGISKEDAALIENSGIELITA
jgi:DeoR family transcriptional regulator, aga operon transcriptional repressor